MCILGQTNTLVQTKYTISICLYVYISIIAAYVSWVTQIVAKVLYNEGLYVQQSNCILIIAFKLVAPILQLGNVYTLYKGLSACIIHKCCLLYKQFGYFTIRVCLYIHTFVILAQLLRDTLLTATLLYNQCLSSSIYLIAYK